MAETLAAAQPAALPEARSRRVLDAEIWIPASLLVLLVGACFLGPIIVHLPPPDAADLARAHLGLGTSGHLLGTDGLGRDLLSRSLYGGRTSLEVGLGSVLLGLAIGGSLGIAVSFASSPIESLVMRVLDVLLAFPSLVLALVVATYLGPSERNVIVAIAFFTIPTYARVARAATVQVRQRDFVTSGFVTGARTSYMIVRHVLPNIAGRLLTFGLLTVAVAIIVEASLSFLGLGVQPPQASWGEMIAQGKAYLSTAPQIVFVPGAFLVVAIVSLNLLGDGIRAHSRGQGRGS